jgi:ribosomal protein S27AE
MAHFHEGSDPSWLTHDCKNCGESTGHALHHDMEKHLCKKCEVVEKRDEKLKSLLGDTEKEKKWYKFWK